MALPRTYGSVMMASPISWSDGTDKKIDSSLVDYVDLLFNLLGVDITYNRFQDMTESERLQFIRDLKIKRLINE